MMPQSKAPSTTSYDTPGVGMTWSMYASAPEATRPETMADSNI